MPPDPLEARASGPSVYRYTRLLYHENPPTSKFNETPADYNSLLVKDKVSWQDWYFAFT